MTRKSIALRSRGFVDGHTTKGKGPIYRLRNILPIPLVLLVALWSEPTLVSLGRGGICLLMGQIIRLWSAGYVGGLRVAQEAQLVTWGPYGLVRNPSAWGTCLVGLGIAIMSGWWVAYLLLVLMVVAGIRYVIPIEEAVLEEQFGEAYMAYREAVPGYLPSGKHLLGWLKEGRGKKRVGIQRFRAQEAWRMEGYMIMFLVGVIGAMVVQWLF